MPPPSQEDWEKLTEVMDFTFNGMRILIENCRTACVAKGIQRIAGRDPDNWAEWMLSRVGQEPLVRLMFIVAVEMTRIGVTVVEIVARDPQLLHDCIENGDLAVYYRIYGHDV
jgi:hypothetical protein